MAIPKVFSFENKQDKFTALSNQRNRWLAGFFVCAIVGVAASFTGLVISGLETLARLQTSVSVDYVAVGLIAAAFPLMALAAHCLDKAADTKRAIKAISYSEKTK